jgi:hypothetical protein
MPELSRRDRLRRLRPGPVTAFTIMLLVAGFVPSTLVVYVVCFSLLALLVAQVVWRFRGVLHRHQPKHRFKKAVRLWTIPMPPEASASSTTQ